MREKREEQVNFKETFKKNRGRQTDASGQFHSKTLEQSLKRLMTYARRFGVRGNREREEAERKRRFGCESVIE